MRDPMFSRFDTIPECDRHTRTDRRRHTTTAYTVLSIGSCGKNRPYCTAHQVYLPGNESRSIANCYADQEMSVITTYLNDNAQTPLNRFVAYILYSHLGNKYSDKSNRWNLGLSLSVASSAVGAVSSSPSSATLLIAAYREAWTIFSNSTAVHTKMGHMSKTMPLLGVICYPFGKT